jgi:sigma-B regulation protein RsbU (phosphoserine phosphatase)
MLEDTILVVDDELPNLQKLQRTFIHRYRVLAANSGMEALKLIEKNEGVSVIIADQRMPDMTGLEFLRKTMAVLPDAVRIILTGYTDVDVLMEAINVCKVFRYIVKPWDPPDLLMTVERGLETQRLAVENARIRKELIRRERLARELEIARDIQRYILPSRCPALDGYEMAVEYHPALEVGGDLYDFFVDPGGAALQVVIGDVSGKSIPAALYGAVFSGQLQTLFANSLKPEEMLARLNSILIARYPAQNYIAVACLQLDLARGSGHLANAGMPYPYLVREGEAAQLKAPGVPLGLLEESTYDAHPFRLQTGDTLILASDGATDAMDVEERIYDPERFLESIRRHITRDVSGLVKSLYTDITEFTGSAEVNDDITIVALRKLR